MYKRQIPHLDHYWFAKKALKIRSGFYVNQHIKGGEPLIPVSYTHLRAHETVLDLVCRLLLEKKKNNKNYHVIHHHTN